MRYTLGVSETNGGAADDYVECVQEMMNDWTNLLGSITNTMTDRCATNNAIDRKLENLTGNKINLFRCAMHPLDTIHSDVEKMIKQYELTHGMDKDQKMPFTHRGESKTQAVIRAVDKLFHNDGCGLPKELPPHIKSKGFGCGENKTLYQR